MVSDITYIYTKEGWLYLAGILDLCSKKIVGWSFGNRLTRDLSIKALEQALKGRNIYGELILHSDRGIQYSCHDYTDLIAKNQIIQSMSGKGNCYDNAVMESFFKTLKADGQFFFQLKKRICFKKLLILHIHVLIQIILTI